MIKIKIEVGKKYRTRGGWEAKVTHELINSGSEFNYVAIHRIKFGLKKGMFHLKEDVGCHDLNGKTEVRTLILNRVPELIFPLGFNAADLIGEIKEEGRNV